MALNRFPQHPLIHPSNFPPTHPFLLALHQSQCLEAS
uniref:Uncharacterized protein n=1 Tax=Anguilla anguilla TaxID=7936 RepID=A0A0E9RV48_ANGAN